MGSDGNVMAMGKSKVANAALQAEKALHSCSPRCNRRTIDLRAQTQIPSVLRSDTPRSI
jgi:hypothetical protein